MGQQSSRFDFAILPSDLWIEFSDLWQIVVADNGMSLDSIENVRQLFMAVEFGSVVMFATKIRRIDKELCFS